MQYLKYGPKLQYLLFIMFIVWLALIHRSHCLNYIEHLFMSLIQLPTELVDLIVDVLAAEHDRRDLLTCALVCRDISSLCRKRIFRIISLDSQTKFAWLYAFIGRDPAIASYIRHLCAVVYVESSYAGVLDVLQMCPHVDTLELTLCGDVLGLAHSVDARLHLASIQKLILCARGVPWGRVYATRRLPPTVRCSFLERLLSGCTSLISLKLDAPALIYDEKTPERRRAPMIKSNLGIDFFDFNHDDTQPGKNVVGPRAQTTGINIQKDLLIACEALGASVSGVELNLAVDGSFTSGQRGFSRALAHFNISVPQVRQTPVCISLGTQRLSSAGARR